MTHRVLIVGVGSIGERHLRCFLTTGRVVAAFVEIDAARRQTVAERYGVENTFTDLDSALTFRPDCAVICTPAHRHIEQAQRLVDAGCHLLIEKPLSTTFDGIDHLRASLLQSRLTGSVAYVYRCHPLLTSMRRALIEQRYGRPVELVATSGQHFPTYRPAYREIYYANRATGGGAIQDALTHVINAGEWLLGPVTRVIADAAHQVLEGVEVEDTVHLLARHGDIPASYSLNQYQAPNELTLTVVCERGTLRWESHKHRWRWLTEPGGEWQQETIAPLERDTLFIAQAHAFLDAIEGHAAPLCPLEEAEQTLRVNLAALASLEKRAWVETHRTRRV